MRSILLIGILVLLLASFIHAGGGKNKKKKGNGSGNNSPVPQSPKLTKSNSFGSGTHTELPQQERGRSSKRLDKNHSFNQNNQETPKSPESSPSPKGKRNKRRSQSPTPRSPSPTPNGNENQQQTHDSPNTPKAAENQSKLDKKSSFKNPQQETPKTPEPLPSPSPKGKGKRRSKSPNPRGSPTSVLSPIPSPGSNQSASPLPSPRENKDPQEGKSFQYPLNENEGPATPNIAEAPKKLASKKSLKKQKSNVSATKNNPPNQNNEQVAEKQKIPFAHYPSEKHMTVEELEQKNRELHMASKVDLSKEAQQSNVSATENSLPNQNNENVAEKIQKIPFAHYPSEKHMTADQLVEKNRELEMASKVDLSKEANLEQSAGIEKFKNLRVQIPTRTFSQFETVQQQENKVENVQTLNEMTQNNEDLNQTILPEPEKVEEEKEIGIEKTENSLPENGVENDTKIVENSANEKFPEFAESQPKTMENKVEPVLEPEIHRVAKENESAKNAFKNRIALFDHFASKESVPTPKNIPRKAGNVLSRFPMQPVVEKPNGQRYNTVVAFDRVTQQNHSDLNELTEWKCFTLNAENKAKCLKWMEILYDFLKNNPLVYFKLADGHDGCQNKMKLLVLKNQLKFAYAQQKQGPNAVIENAPMNAQECRYKMKEAWQEVLNEMEAQIHDFKALPVPIDQLPVAFKNNGVQMTYPTFKDFAEKAIDAITNNENPPKFPEKSYKSEDQLGKEWKEVLEDLNNYKEFIVFNHNEPKFKKDVMVSYTFNGNKADLYNLLLLAEHIEKYVKDTKKPVYIDVPKSGGFRSKLSMWECKFDPSKKC